MEKNILTNAKLLLSRCKHTSQDTLERNARIRLNLSCDYQQETAFRWEKDERHGWITITVVRTGSPRTNILLHNATRESTKFLLTFSVYFLLLFCLKCLKSYKYSLNRAQFHQLQSLKFQLCPKLRQTLGAEVGAVDEYYLLIFTLYIHSCKIIRTILVTFLLKLILVS